MSGVAFGPMAARTLAMLVVSLVALGACERSENSKTAPQGGQPPLAAKPGPTQPAPSFVNRVWEVVESKQASPGDMRVFLSDGTLVMASPKSKPAFGGWRYEDGRLTITEEGQDYPVDILGLSEREFRIRMHSPGEPVEIRFAPAKPVPPQSVQAAEAVHSAPTAVSLQGTAWRLENLAGAGVLDNVQATLEFPSEGRTSGNGSCNRFNGVVTIKGEAIRFGGIAATRKACAEAVMRQEDAYFSALRSADRFEMDGQSLEISAPGKAEPLRFVASRATAERPANSTSRAPATAALAATSIWIVVGHQNPGISALTDEAARARYGETVRLTPAAAISSGHRCGEPGYTGRTVPAGSYLASEFKVSPGSLKPLAGRDQIHLMEVSCGGGPWAALGERIIEIDKDRALAPWDGVFYELARDHDFRGVGQEPGWQLEIRKGAEMRFIYDYGNGTAVTPAPKHEVDSSSGTRTYHAQSDGNELEVVIVPVSCADSMSGKPYPATVSVSLNGKKFRGCGGELATPFQG